MISIPNSTLEKTEKKNILIVIDRLGLKQRVAQACAGNGLRLFSAYNAFSALDIARDKDIHILVTDLEMYRMDGVKLAREICKLNSKKKVFCIVLCFSEENYKVYEGSSDLPDICLIDPITDDDISKSIKNAIQQENYV